MIDSLYFFQTFVVILSQTTNDIHRCGPSICCSDYYMKGESCQICEDGTYGTNCSEVCQGGYFGRLCKSECPTSCMFTCNKVTGNCNHQAPAADNSLESFLKNNSWIIVTGTSTLMIMSFGCIAFLFCHHIRKRKDIPLIAETKQRNSEQESVRQGKYTPRRSQKILKRNEVSLMFRDEDSGRNKNLKQLIEISTDIKECTLNSIPDDRNEVHIGNTHLSDRKHKYWYSLAKKFEITDEIDISQEFSDDEDVFDSDNDVEYDSMSVE